MAIRHANLATSDLREPDWIEEERKLLMPQGGKLILRTFVREVDGRIEYVLREREVKGWPPRKRGILEPFFGDDLLLD